MYNIQSYGKELVLKFLDFNIKHFSVFTASYVIFGDVNMKLFIYSTETVLYRIFY